METTKVLELYEQVTSAYSEPFPYGTGSAVTSFKYSAKRMGNAPTISATLLYQRCLDNEWSDRVYTVFNGEKYRLRNTPSSSFDNTSCLYKHNLEFVSERVVLESVYFFDVVLNDGAEGDPLSTNSDFMFTGGLNEFAERFNRSAKWSGLDYIVTIDEGITAEEKPMKFQDQFLYDALKTMYDTFDVPFYFKGTDIHIGYAENEIEDIIRYGVDDALISVNRNNTGEQIINRITGIGSDRNITYYYPNPTPKGWLEANVNKGNFTVGITNQKKFAKNVELNAAIDYISPFPADSHITKIRHLDAYGMTSSAASVYNPANGYYSVSGHVNFQLEMDVRVLYTAELVTNLKLNCPDDPSMQDAYRIFFEDDPSSEYFANTYIVSSMGTIYKPVIIAGLSCNFGVVPVGEYTLYVSIDNFIYGQNLNRKRWYPTITANANWVNSSTRKMLRPADSGFQVIGSAPMVGDSFTPNVSLRVSVQNNLMPSKYRKTDGLERFYNAENGRYADENNTSIYFPNPYSDTRPREHILRNEEIYPSIAGMVNANNMDIDEVLEVAYDYSDNDEIYPEGDPNAGKYKHPYFFIKLRKFDGDNGFNLFDHAIENNQMTISMTTGSCGACEFTIGVNDNNKNTVQVDENGNLLRDDYGNVRCSREGMPVETPQDVQNDTVNNEVWIALKKDTNTYGVVMPNVTNKQYVNAEDKFVILHIDLPEAYVLAAEKRLENAVIKYMAEHNSEKYSYSVKFSRIFFEENDEIAPLINENAKICLEYNGKIEELYVTSFSYNMSDSSPLPEISIELEPSITIKKGVIQQLREQSNNILKPQLVAINKSLNSNEITIKTLQTTVSNTNQSNQLLIEDIQNRLLTLEESTGVVDLTELKIQVNNIDDRVTNVEKRVAVKVVTVQTT